MCAVLPGHRHVRGGEVRSPGVLPLLHQDAGAVRAEVLRRLPGTARQGAASPLLSSSSESSGLGLLLLYTHLIHAEPRPHHSHHTS